MLAEPHGAAADRADRLGSADAHDWMSGKERRQMCGDANRAHAGSAAAVRNGERLVQVQVAHVGADGGRARQPDLRVHVRAVHVDLSAVLMNDRADLLDRVFEHAVRRRVGHHQRRKTIAMLLGLGFEIGDVDVAVRVGRDDDDFESGHHRARGIRAVR